MTVTFDTKDRIEVSLLLKVVIKKYSVMSNYNYSTIIRIFRYNFPREEIEVSFIFTHKLPNGSLKYNPYLLIICL